MKRKGTEGKAPNSHFRLRQCGLAAYSSCTSGRNLSQLNWRSTTSTREGATRVAARYDSLRACVLLRTVIDERTGRTGHGRAVEWVPGDPACRVLDGPDRRYSRTVSHLGHTMWLWPDAAAAAVDAKADWYLCHCIILSLELRSVVQFFRFNLVCMLCAFITVLFFFIYKDSILSIVL